MYKQVGKLWTDSFYKDAKQHHRDTYPQKYRNHAIIFLCERVCALKRSVMWRPETNRTRNRQHLPSDALAHSSSVSLKSTREERVILSDQFIKTFHSSAVSTRHSCIGSFTNPGHLEPRQRWNARWTWVHQTHMVLMGVNGRFLPEPHTTTHHFTQLSNSSFQGVFTHTGVNERWKWYIFLSWYRWHSH